MRVEGTEEDLSFYSFSRQAVARQFAGVCYPSFSFWATVSTAIIYSIFSLLMIMIITSPSRGEEDARQCASA